MAYELIEFERKVKSRQEPDEICIGLADEERFTTYSRVLNLKTARKTGSSYPCLSWSGNSIARFGLMYVKKDEYLQRLSEITNHSVVIEEPEMTVGTYRPF